VADDPTQEAAPKPETGRGAVWEFNRDHIWPAAIVVGLIVVALVNFAFIYIAVSGADEVAPSYVTGPR